MKLFVMVHSSEISGVVMGKRRLTRDSSSSGIAPVEDAAELEYFPRWIAEGHAGEMKYLAARDEQGRLKRASLANAAPWARSVVVCAINYNTAHPYSTQAEVRFSRGKPRMDFALCVGEAGLSRFGDAAAPASGSCAARGWRR